MEILKKRKTHRHILWQDILIRGGVCGTFGGAHTWSSNDWHVRIQGGLLMTMITMNIMMMMMLMMIGAHTHGWAMPTVDHVWISSSSLISRKILHLLCKFYSVLFNSIVAVIKNISLHFSHSQGSWIKGGEERFNNKYFKVNWSNSQTIIQPKYNGPINEKFVK